MKDRYLWWTRKDVELEYRHALEEGRQLQTVAKEFEALKKAQELDPNNAEVHYRLGIAYNKQGRHNVAIECLSRAVELNAKHCDAMNALGGIYVWFYKKDTTQTDFLKKGLQHWNASLEVNPQQAHIVALVSKWSKELK